MFVLIQIWLFFLAKPLHEPMLIYCQLDPQALGSVNQNTKVFYHKMHFKKSTIWFEHLCANMNDCRQIKLYKLERMFSAN